jgi:hypothetical protein
LRCSGIRTTRILEAPMPFYRNFAQVIGIGAEFAGSSVAPRILASAIGLIARNKSRRIDIGERVIADVGVAIIALGVAPIRNVRVGRQKTSGHRILNSSEHVIEPHVT